MKAIKCLFTGTKSQREEKVKVAFDRNTFLSRHPAETLLTSPFDDPF
jgi:hypothetical protein